MIPFWSVSGGGRCINLSGKNKTMTEIVALIFIMTLLLMMAYLVLRRVRHKDLEEAGDNVAPAVLLVNSCLFVSDCSVGGDIAGRISLDLMLLLIPLMLLSSSIWNKRVTYRICMWSAYVQIVMAICYLLCRFGFLQVASHKFYIIGISSVSIMNATLVWWGTWIRINNIRNVMRSGTVLNSLGLELELIYAVAIQTLAVLIAVSLVMRDCSTYAVWIPSFLELILVIAFCVRISEGSLFVVMHDYERRIMESLNISQAEIASGCKKDSYRELYDRLVEYFETDKPYLDSRLSINDVVKTVFSNKVYISRAISQYTGRNFCQFVNYYRIMYSVECFRSNPELKVTDMSEMSGFNSVVSYNTAFRLFMNENPSDWCRKERYKIRNKKK